MKPDLVVLSRSYPFGTIDCFLIDEMPHLMQYFERVVVVPSSLVDWSEPQVPVPPGMIVSTKDGRDLSSRLDALPLHSTLARMLTQELIARPRIALSPRRSKHLAWYMIHAVHTYRMLSRAMRDHEIDPSRAIVYSYWAGPMALAAALLRAMNPELRTLSRFHGGDLYEERHKPAYLPLRDFLATHIDRLVFISEMGRDYFASRWPSVDTNKLHVSRLGVRPSIRRCEASYGASHAARLEVVSCSYLVPVKRVDLIFEAIRVQALENPGLRVRWTHMGAGGSFDTLAKAVASTHIDNLEIELTGTLTAEQVLTRYASQPFDVFVNASESEGVPVSIMEAFSAGIPAVATDVGGTREIVDDTCGALVPADVTAPALAKAILGCASDVDRHQALRKGAERRWAERYDAEKNFRGFADVLLALKER